MDTFCYAMRLAPDFYTRMTYSRWLERFVHIVYMRSRKRLITFLHQIQTRYDHLYQHLGIVPKSSLPYPLYTKAKFPRYHPHCELVSIKVVVHHRHRHFEEAPEAARVLPLVVKR